MPVNPPLLLLFVPPRSLHLSLLLLLLLPTMLLGGQGAGDGGGGGGGGGGNSSSTAQTPQIRGASVAVADIFDDRPPNSNSNSNAATDVAKASGSRVASSQAADDGNVVGGEAPIPLNNENAVGLDEVGIQDSLFIHRAHGVPLRSGFTQTEQQQQQQHHPRFSNSDNRRSLQISPNTQYSHYQYQQQQQEDHGVQIVEGSLGFSMSSSSSAATLTSSPSSSPSSLASSSSSSSAGPSSSAAFSHVTNVSHTTSSPMRLGGGVHSAINAPVNPHHLAHGLSPGLSVAAPHGIEDEVEPGKPMGLPKSVRDSEPFRDETLLPQAGAKSSGHNGRFREGPGGSRLGNKAGSGSEKKLLMARDSLGQPVDPEAFEEACDEADAANSSEYGQGGPPTGPVGTNSPGMPNNRNPRNRPKSLRRARLREPRELGDPKFQPIVHASDEDREMRRLRFADNCERELFTTTYTDKLQYPNERIAPPTPEPEVVPPKSCCTIA